MLKKGDKIIDFRLKDQNGIERTNSEFLGKKVVLFFYPNDDSFGCTKEACAFRDSYTEFKEYDCEVIGISQGTVDSKSNFVQKNRLNFILLADEGNKLRMAFGIKPNFFGFIQGRVTFIIDKEGIIQGIYDSQINFSKHIKTALSQVKKM
ncbi:MAG: peroxiredoxin [Flavobacteriia bacterium]|nr:peroxiredoxin [Flavobacteriia bacterium]